MAGRDRADRRPLVGHAEPGAEIGDVRRAEEHGAELFVDGGPQQPLRGARGERFSGERMDHPAALDDLVRFHPSSVGPHATGIAVASVAYLTGGLRIGLEVGAGFTAWLVSCGKGRAGRWSG